MVTLEEVSFHYHKQHSGSRQYILRNISLQVKTGSFCGIVGPNGSGKTTLLNLITGQLSPASGHIRMK